MYTIKRDSWHYKFNRRMITRYEQMPNDFCSYWSMTMRHFFKAVLFSLPIIGIAALIGAAIYTDPLAALIVVFGAIFMIFFILFLSFVVLDFIPYLVRKFTTSKSNKPEKEPGIITMKYRSWKQKHCLPIKYED